jgi:hypothetical protein
MGSMVIRKRQQILFFAKDNKGEKSEANHSIPVDPGYFNNHFLYFSVQ